MDSNDKKRRGSKVQRDRRNDYFGLNNDDLLYNSNDYNKNYDKYDLDSLDNPFFTQSKVSLNVNERTNKADDFFENKDYKPWDDRDDFNKRTSRVRMENTPKVRRKNLSKSRMKNLTSGVGRVSKRVFSAGDDENLYLNEEQEREGIADNLKNTRKNKKLLDELNSKKKPLTKRQRKLKNICLSGGIVLVVLIIGTILSLTVLFKCEKIEVSGVSRYNANDIIAASNLRYGENIFMSDKASAASCIEAKYPYIEKADITFGIPNRLIINVTEAMPEYYIQDGTRFYIISKDSKILEEVVERELDIPTIIGCKLKDVKVGETAKVENNKILAVLDEIATTMDANSVTGVKEINLSDMSNIELNYQNRITIALGMPEYIDYKMRTAMTIIFTKLSENDKGRLDCSNLIEDRTDGKSNKSYFAPNNVIGEKATEQASQPTTEPSTVPQTQSGSSVIEEPVTAVPDDTEGTTVNYSDTGLSGDNSYENNSYSDDTYTDDISDNV